MVMNFVISKYLIVKSAVFLHCIIHISSWTSSDGNTHSQIDYILIR